MTTKKDVPLTAANRAEEFKQAFRESDVIWTKSDMDDTYGRLASVLAFHVRNSIPILMPIMNGGLHLYSELSRRFSKVQGMRYEFDYIHASRYKNERHGSQLLGISDPHSDVSNRTVLLIDDIFDKGLTLDAVRTHLRDLGADVVTVVTCLKACDRDPTIEFPTYVGCTVPDRFVFGCGMDYKGFGRNLSCIRAEKK